MDMKNNRLLAALPAKERERLRPKLKPIDLEAGQTLYRFGEHLRYAYFPLTAVVSKIFFSGNGDTTGVGLIGAEGVVGASSFLCGNETVAEAVVIQPGTALRLGSREIGEEFEHGDAFQRTLLGFTQAFMTQMGQKAVCNQHHSVKQRLCCWLLLYLDRAASDELRITHELLSRIIGVRREGITRAAVELRRDGILSYRHGKMTILDRAGLHSRSCECYDIVNKAYETCCPLPAEDDEPETSPACAS